MSNTDSTKPTHPTAGRWLLRTETSSYELDLDARTVRRTPGAGAGPTVDLPAPLVADLRRDNDVVPLIALDRCKVGVPVVMVVDVRGDGLTANLLPDDQEGAPKVTVGDEDILVGQLGSYVVVKQGAISILCIVTRISEQEKLAELIK